MYVCMYVCMYVYIYIYITLKSFIKIQLIYYRQNDDTYNFTCGIRWGRGSVGL